MSSTEQTIPVWAGAAPVDITPAPMPPAPNPPAGSSKLKTVLVGVLAALVLGGGGFAVVRAAGSSSASTSQQAGPGTAQGGQAAGGQAGAAPDGMGGGRGGGMGGGAGGLTGAMYGDFVTSDGNGGYATKRLQSGTVTAVSTTSITAKSADGHTTTFVVTATTAVDNGADAIGDVKAGDTVTVIGTLSGDTATATTITDSALAQAGGNGGGQPPAGTN